MGQFGQKRGKKGVSGSHITYFLGKPPGVARGVTGRAVAGGGGDPRIQEETLKSNRLCERAASRRRVSPFIPVNTRHVSKIIRTRQTCPEFAVAASSKVQNAGNRLCNYIRSYTCSLRRRKPGH